MNLRTSSLVFVFRLNVQIVIHRQQYRTKTTVSNDQESIPGSSQALETRLHQLSAVDHIVKKLLTLPYTGAMVHGYVLFGSSPKNDSTEFGNEFPVRLERSSAMALPNW
jgi:hypothetical protein